MTSENEELGKRVFHSSPLVPELVSEVCFQVPKFSYIVHEPFEPYSKCVHLQRLVILGGLYFRLSSNEVFMSSTIDLKVKFISYTERRWMGDFPGNKVGKQYFLSCPRLKFQYLGATNNFVFMSK